MENTGNPGALPGGSSQFDPTRFRRIKVFIFTTNGLFSGYTYCQHQQRLLDALNKGFFTSRLQTTTDFLPLFEVEAFFSGAGTRRMDTVYIRKSNILFVGEGESDAPPAAAGSYPLRRKKTIQTVINLPQTSITGNMYSEMWEELQDSLNRSDQFIPVTNVVFEPALAGNINRSAFAAVNKDHIIYVGK
jgi:hypothetical protein